MKAAACMAGAVLALLVLGAAAELDAPNFYESGLAAHDIHGNELSMSQFAGKVTLVVNVASQCGYTESNYQGIEQLSELYHEHGLEVLAFPCNQFGKQEPGTPAEIGAFVNEKYPKAGARILLMEKVEVNGGGQHPIWAWLKKHAPAIPGQQQGADVQWNFEKFLIDNEGRPIKRYSSSYDGPTIQWDVYDELMRTADGQPAPDAELEAEGEEIELDMGEDVELEEDQGEVDEEL